MEFELHQPHSSCININSVCLLHSLILALIRKFSTFCFIPITLMYSVCNLDLHLCFLICFNYIPSIFLRVRCPCDLLKHVESSICNRAMPFAVKPNTIMPKSNSLQASEGQWCLRSFDFQSIGFVLTKYQCPSLARYLLLLGKNVFGFAAKGIARSQIDDSTCCYDKFEETPNEKVVNMSKLTKPYFSLNLVTII